MEYIFIWLGCGVLSAIVASNKNRSAFAWFALGFLFGPFGFVASLVVSNNNENSVSPVPKAANSSSSPSISNEAENRERAQLVKHGIEKNREADGSFVYRINGRRLKSFDMAIKVAEEMNQQNVPKYKQCPYCAEDIRLEAKICRFCNREVSESE